MIDLDLSNFKYCTKALNLAKAKTLAKIQDTFNLSNFEPATVIWSGNGYHLYIPVDSQNVILEQMSEFKNYKEPSKLFLRFAEWYLSNGKADSKHYHTVYITQKIDARLTLCRIGMVLYSNFLAYLIDRCSTIVKRNNNKTNIVYSENFNSVYVSRKNSVLLEKKQSIEWIEQLLQTPLAEYRKYCIWRILAPYFINVRHLSFCDSYDIICQWLENCNRQRALNFDPETKIKDCLNRAINTGYLPLSLDKSSKEPRTLKTENKELYNIISG
jgi:hypothetical protein